MGISPGSVFLGLGSDEPSGLREVFDVGGDDCDDTCRGYGDDDKEAVGNVFDPDTFSTLVGLLTDYDLVGVLSGDDPITVS